jgi:hypothetical protein
VRDTVELGLSEEDTVPQALTVKELLRVPESEPLAEEVAETLGDSVAVSELLALEDTE